MEAIVKPIEGTVEIEGETWHTKESLMSCLNIQKSTFYNLRNSGHIIVKRLFSDKRTIFFVYKLEEEGCENG